MEYFCILADDARFADRWFLSAPRDAAGREIDSREFRYGRPYFGRAPVTVSIGQAGRRVAFHLGSFDMPVVTRQIGLLLDSFANRDIQRFPITIGHCIERYEILNVVGQERCVDEARSNVRKWGPEDERPDKIGQYKEIWPLVIDPARAGGRHLLRIWGSLVELLVSDRVRDALEGIPDLGIVFQPVSGPAAGNEF